MPPWLPEAGYGEFANERRLSSSQIERIEQWAAQGAVEGEARDLPARPQWPSGWQLGRPDLVVTLPQPYILPAGGVDVFRNFVLQLPLDSTRYVQGIEFRPANPHLVHHGVIRVDPTRASRRLDENDPHVGYDGMHYDASENPDGRFLGWTPGKTPSMEADDMSWRLEPGTDLIVQLHLLPTSRPEPVQFQIGFVFTDTAPTREPFLVHLGSHSIDIPAGVKNHQVTDEYLLPADVEALGIYPHAHYLAKEVKAFANLPDGTVRWLIWIKDWDFDWQDVYAYSTPVLLPRGTTVRMEFIYDNSSENPRNPHTPPRRVLHGQRSSDEMADLFLQVVPRNPDGMAALERVRWERELNYRIAASEKLLSVDPRNAEEHNFLGARYLEAQKFQQAAEQLREALRLKPGYAAAHTNLGSVLREQGRLFEAISQFQLAIASDPRFAQAHNNLAVALASQGQLDEAIQHFRLAVKNQPDYGEALASLGVALALRGQTTEAISNLRRALEINPRDVAARDSLNRLQQAPR